MTGITHSFAASASPSPEGGLRLHVETTLTRTISGEVFNVSDAYFDLSNPLHVLQLARKLVSDHVHGLDSRDFLAVHAGYEEAVAGIDVLVSHLLGQSF